MMWIIDAGYAIRQVNPKDTYKEYYTDLLSWMLPERTSRPSSVVIAVDDYRTESVKDGERRKRRDGEDEGRRVYVTGMNQKMPKGKVKCFQFLSSGENKNDLMALFGHFLMSSDAVDLANGIPLIFCGRKEVLYQIVWRFNKVVFPLFASKANSNVVAVAADCDILVLLVNTYAINKPSFQWQMKYETNKYANIRDICKTLGNVASSLVNFHIISGCDTTSYFFRQGKKIHSKNRLKLVVYISLRP